MTIRDPQRDKLPRGGADTWDQRQASVLLLDDVFASVVAGAGTAAGVATASAVGAVGQQVRVHWLEVQASAGGATLAAGAAAGTATAAAVGVDLEVRAGTSAGVATAAAVGATIVAAVGTAAGSATAASTGQAFSAAAGSSAGTATAAATGTALVATSGSSAGVATAAATGTALVLAAGTSAGTATVTGASSAASFVAGAGSSDGTATAAAVGATIQAGAGTAAGVATATAVGIDLEVRAGTSAGVATATATGVAIVAAAGTSAGVATVTGTSSTSNFAAGAGTAAGAATAAATGVAIQAVAGTSAGVATAAGVSNAAGVSQGAGASAGTATAAAVGAAIVAGAGTAAAVATAAAAGATVRPAAGTSASTATVAGSSLQIAAGAGVAEGTATASAQAIAIVVAAGTAAGTSTAVGTYESDIQTTEDLDAFFAEFSVPATWGSEQARVLLDATTEDVFGTRALAVDYLASMPITTFQGMGRGAQLVIDGSTYTVREVRLLDDGGIKQATLRLASGTGPVQFADGAGIASFFDVADFAQTATWSAQTAQIIFDAITEDDLSGKAITDSYRATLAAGAFPGIARGAQITSGGSTYEVREVRAVGEGGAKVLTLRLASGSGPTGFADDDSIDQFFTAPDFTKRITWGAQQTNGMMDTPGTDVFGDQALTDEFVATIKRAAFPGIKRGDTVTVGPLNYRVREVRHTGDGAIKTLTLGKL